MTDACAPIVVQVTPPPTPVLQTVQQNTVQQTVVAGTTTQSPTLQQLVEQTTSVALEQQPTITDVVTQYLGPPGPAGATGPQGPPGPTGAGADSAIPAIEFAFGDAPHAVWTADRSGVMSEVRLLIATPFDGVGAQIKVGLSIGSEELLPSMFNSPYQVADYDNTPDLHMIAGQSVFLTITPGMGATLGSGMLLLTFIPD